MTHCCKNGPGKYLSASLQAIVTKRQNFDAVYGILVMYFLECADHETRSEQFTAFKENCFTC